MLAEVHSADLCALRPSFFVFLGQRERDKEMHFPGAGIVLVMRKDLQEQIVLG